MLSFYVHIPYCIKRCGYCDFNTYTPSELQDGATLEIVSADYIDAVLRELATTPTDEVSTIFFGGGTPSLMPPATVAALIVAAERHWGFDDNVEITLEANPSSVESARFADLAHAGVNRVSLGLQALDDDVLAFLGRAHSVDEYVNVERNAFINGLSSGLALVVAVANLDWTKK